jgi:hypothetical protein
LFDILAEGEVEVEVGEFILREGIKGLVAFLC